MDTALESDILIHSHASGMKMALSGIIGGITAKFIEHPFDTIKVRLQATAVSGEAHSFNSPLDCLSQTLRYEGFRGLYRGLTSPLFGCIVESGIAFFIYGAAMTFITHRLPFSSDSSSPNTSTISTANTAVISTLHPPLWVHYVCGGLAGLCTGFFLTPIELVKCRLQIQQNVTPESGKYSGPINCLTTIVRTAGIRGLWRGLGAAWGRDIPGNTLWFGASGSISSLLTPDDEEDPPISAKIIAGSTGGVLYWTIPYPFDVIKSRQQVEKGKSTLKQIARSIYVQEGIRGFYRGMSVCILRTIPTSATLYTTATLVNKMIA
eukprot:TRINITY_DN2468_c1_g1_i1.p1 TRINITY_DN2468_c1_g1~~TRINITY_DN2468_c1_g1_i1.p1  ORF type:complete len:321 (-),score=51.56 TRINITY_DN2468_c1_g1_i1:328-1290(-)